MKPIAHLNTLAVFMACSQYPRRNAGAEATTVTTPIAPGTILSKEQAGAAGAIMLVCCYDDEWMSVQAGPVGYGHE